jgi:hypothetical protein
MSRPKLDEIKARSKATTPGPALKAASELAEVTATCAAMREALEAINGCISYSDTMAQWVLIGAARSGPAIGKVRAALAPDAGRALLAELAAHREDVVVLHRQANDLRSEVESWVSATGCGTAEQFEKTLAALREVVESLRDGDALRRYAELGEGRLVDALKAVPR